MIAELHMDRVIATPFIIAAVAVVVLGVCWFAAWAEDNFGWDPFTTIFGIYIVCALCLGIGLNIYAGLVTP